MSQNITKVSSEFQVNTYTSNGQQSPSLGTFSDGKFVVAWMSRYQDSSGWGVYG